MSPHPCCVSKAQLSWSWLKPLLLTAVLVVVVGLSRSEGGFKENKVSSASVLDVQAANDKKGKPYYKYEILTRTGTPAVSLLQVHKPAVIGKCLP